MYMIILKGKDNSRYKGLVDYRHLMPTPPPSIENNQSNYFELVHRAPIGALRTQAGVKRSETPA